MQRMACQGFSPCGGGGSADFVSIDSAPGVEKLSVVTALARLTGYRLFDNDISLSIDWTLTVLSTDAMGDSPFLIYLDASKKKATVRIDFSNDKKLGTRFPFGTAALT
jgi:hypothetical protein